MKQEPHVFGKDLLGRILRCFIWNEPFPPDAWPEQETAALLARIGRTNLMGVLQSVLPPDRFEETAGSTAAAAKFTRGHIVEGLKKQKAAADLSAQFASAGIPHAVLRGVAVARDYPEPLARWMSDMDVLIPHEAREEVTALFEQQGIAVDARLRSQRVYRFQGVKTEVHERLLTPNRFAHQNRMFSDWPQQVQTVSAGSAGSLCVLNASYGLISDVLHALTHHDLEKLLYGVDFACRIVHGGPDWPQVLDWVRRARVQGYFSFSLGFAGWILGSRFLDCLPPAEVDAIRQIPPQAYLPFWKRAVRDDSPQSFLARRYRVFRCTDTADLRFKLAWRMCFGEDARKLFRMINHAPR